MGYKCDDLFNLIKNNPDYKDYLLVNFNEILDNCLSQEITSQDNLHSYILKYWPDKTWLEPCSLERSHGVHSYLSDIDILLFYDRMYELRNYYRKSNFLLKNLYGFIKQESDSIRDRPKLNKNQKKKLKEYDIILDTMDRKIDWSIDM
jgi:hypothetical protein